MDAPSAILAIVLLELAVGGHALLWAAPTWGNVRHGYEMLNGGLMSLAALGSWAALRGPLETVAGDTATLAAQLVLASAGVGFAAVVLLALRLATLGRIAGILAVVVGLAAFWPLADLRGDVAFGFLELVLGAFFLGAVWDGMFLGHWYLTDRRLSNRYMVWMAWVNVAAVVAGLGAVLLSARNPAPVGAYYSPLLGVGSFTIVMGIGLVALVALISGFNVKLAREGGRSIQAATGMFYLAVIMAPAAEFAAKIRFF